MYMYVCVYTHTHDFEMAPVKGYHSIAGDLKCFNNTDCDSMFECIDEECVCKEEFYNDGDNCTRRK